jgi:hypothetical protein
MEILKPPKLKRLSFNVQMLDFLMALSLRTRASQVAKPT